ncbi:hypothetical protein GmRootV512_53930 [Variovorax sp. V512]
MRHSQDMGATVLLDRGSIDPCSNHEGPRTGPCAPKTFAQVPKMEIEPLDCTH